MHDYYQSFTQKYKLDIFVKNHVTLKDNKDVSHTWASLELEDGRTVHSRLVVCGKYRENLWFLFPLYHSNKYLRTYPKSLHEVTLILEFKSKSLFLETY